jgi:type I restriction enzyme M protein
VTLTAPQLKSLIYGLSERDDAAPILTDAKGNPLPDTDARDTENVPLGEDVQAYFKREVLPHAPDAWIDETKSKVGYEIPFNRHFYVFEPQRDLREIDEDLKGVSARIVAMLGELAE